MSSWSVAVGNLVSRAPRPPAAVSPALEDSLLPLANLGTGYPDQEGGLQWRSDGAYAIDFDTNLLAEESEASDAPTGWRDLQLSLAGTPGLPADPPEWGTFGGRTALKFYGPVYQDVEVGPGEKTKITGGIYLLAASTATGVVVQVVDLKTGKQYDAGVAAWDDDGEIAEQTTDDTWLDFAVEIEADPDQVARRTYRVVVTPTAGAYTSSTYGYISANGGSGSPALFGTVDLVALLGNKIPEGATVGLVPQPSGTTIAVPITRPSSYAVAEASQLVQVWRLSIAIPAALRPSAGRPIIGEVWIGRAQELLVKSPSMPSIGVTASAPGQVRVEGGRGRIEVVPGDDEPIETLEMSFKSSGEAAYQQIRRGVAELVRFGADPLLLIPAAAFEGAGRVYHGRIEDRISFAHIVPPSEGGDDAIRTFSMPLHESPLAGA